MMDAVFAGQRWTFCLVYLDDKVIQSKTLHEHAVRLKSVLRCLEAANLKVKLSKCEFSKTELQALGHVVSKGEIRPDPAKIQAVERFPKPKDNEKIAERLQTTRSFVGLCSYYRRFVKDFARIAKPLHEFINKAGRTPWGVSEAQSFENLKTALISATSLAYPDQELPFEIHPEACEYGIGSVLLQKTEGGERPLAFASRLLTKTERNYSITEKNVWRWYGR